MQSKEDISEDFFFFCYFINGMEQMIQANKELELTTQNDADSLLKVQTSSVR